MFKICLIGCGYMTRSCHGPSCKKYADEHEDVVLAACSDLKIEKAEEACTKFGFRRAYADYLEMIEKEKPDVVLLITPVKLTPELSISLLERKIPVIMEKPPGMTAEENMRIHEAAVRNNTPARVAFNRRYTPLLRALKEEIAQINRPVLDVDCMFVRINRKDDDFSTTAIHAIDAVRYLAGSEYRDVSLQYHDILVDEKTVTNIKLTAKMQNGSSTSVTFLPCGGSVIERITVTLCGYSFFLQLPVWGGSDAPGRLICMKDDKVYKTIQGEDLVKEYTLYESNGFYDESRIFFDELREGKHPVSDVITGHSSVAIAQCIRHKKESYECRQ